MKGKLPPPKKSVWFRSILAAGVLCIMISFMAHSTTNEVQRAMTTDSDGDGFTDWQEWQAGTNPGDSNSCLRITSAKVEAGKIILSWKSVSRRTYNIVSAATLGALATNAQRILVMEKASGTGPWHETVSTITNNLGSNARFFRIESRAGQDFEQSVMDMATFE